MSEERDPASFPFAAELAGLKADAKVGLYLYNGNEYLESQFAALKLRAVPININYRYLDDELHYLIENSDAEALIFHTSLGDRVARVMDRCPEVALWVQVDDGGERIDGALAYEDVIAEHEPGGNLRIEEGRLLGQHAPRLHHREQLGGGDAGPNPVEVVLAALGSCQEITYKVYAAAMGIKLRRVSVSLSGDIDLRGLFGVDDSVRAGFQSIRGEVDIDADTSPEKLTRLKAAVDAHCPVLDMLQNGVPVELELKASA